MSVHYKFNAAKEFDTLPVDGLHISLGDLKEAIIHHKRLGKGDVCDLQVTNAETKEVYTDERALIPKNSSLIIARIPIDPALRKFGNLSREDKELLLANPEYRMNTEGAEEAELLSRRLEEVPDLTKYAGTEDEKISAMIAQSTIDFHPSRYLKLRNTVMQGKVPSFYKCYKCHQGGHWVTNCPLNNQDLRKSTGIPSQFLMEVKDKDAPGVMITPSGKYVVFRQSLFPELYRTRVKVSEFVRTPEELICLLCKELLKDAVITPCCTSAFCDDCIRNELLESDDHVCPECHKSDVGPDGIIPNRYLRLKVQQFGHQFFMQELESEGEEPIQSPGSASKSVGGSRPHTPIAHLYPDVSNESTVNDSGAKLGVGSDKENDLMKDNVRIIKRRSFKATLVKDALPASPVASAEDADEGKHSKSKKHSKKSKKKHKEDKKHKKEKKKKTKRKISKDEEEKKGLQNEKLVANSLLNEAVCPTFDPSIPPPNPSNLHSYPSVDSAVSSPYNHHYLGHIPPHHHGISSSSGQRLNPPLDDNDPLASFTRYLKEKDERKRRRRSRSFSRTPPYRPRSRSTSRPRRDHKRSYSRSRSRSGSPSRRRRIVGGPRSGRSLVSPSPNAHHPYQSPPHDRSRSLSRSPSPGRRFRISLEGGHYYNSPFPPHRLEQPISVYSLLPQPPGQEYPYPGPGYQFNDPTFPVRPMMPHPSGFYDGRGRGFARGRGRGRGGFHYEGGPPPPYMDGRGRGSYHDDRLAHSGSRRGSMDVRKIEERRSRERYLPKSEEELRRRRREEESEEWAKKIAEKRNKDESSHHRSSERRHSPDGFRKSSPLEKLPRYKRGQSPREGEPHRRSRREDERVAAAPRDESFGRNKSYETPLKEVKVPHEKEVRSRSKEVMTREPKDSQEKKERTSSGKAADEKGKGKREKGDKKEKEVSAGRQMRWEKPAVPEEADSAKVPLPAAKEKGAMKETKEEKEKRKHERRKKKKEKRRASTDEAEERKKRKREKKKQKQSMASEVEPEEENAMQTLTTESEGGHSQVEGASYLPELSRWERDDEEEMSPLKQASGGASKEAQSLVTSDVLKRAENVLFSKGLMNNRSLGPRKGYADPHKGRDKEEPLRSPTPDWEKAELREARKKGASIQITISSKLESQIGRHKCQKSTETDNQSPNTAEGDPISEESHKDNPTKNRNYTNKDPKKLKLDDGSSNNKNEDKETSQLISEKTKICVSEVETNISIAESSTILPSSLPLKEWQQSESDEQPVKSHNFATARESQPDSCDGSKVDDSILLASTSDKNPADVDTFPERRKSELEEGELIDRGSPGREVEAPESTEDQNGNCRSDPPQGNESSSAVQEVNKDEKGPGLNVTDLSPPPPFIKREPKKRNASTSSSSSSSSSDSSSDDEGRDSRKSKRKRRRRRKGSSGSSSSEDETKKRKKTKKDKKKKTKNKQTNK